MDRMNGTHDGQTYAVTVTHENSVWRVTGGPVYRQVVRVVTFTADHVPFINWQALADMRRDLGSDMIVTTHEVNGLTVEFSWPYPETEVPEAVLMKAVAGSVEP
jgi:hypothetical protein